ncbi:MAG: transcriptional regulator [Candidatus Brocadia sp. AMX2]|uniref:Nitrogen regulatory protein PII n=1 Tax=Candidatus Brocadia sinica JPN1 TaxID=1197129 RepID=A0ABQ0JZ90_9BACT|nr:MULTISPECIES: P-II family nitrogen regulator [Brocadia]KXK30884.1 MAG: nitrogen regulatory protein [Candidatus Brocadia sinica]MBC6931200.1 transcriptional regulator [Candidatus Brocadia sp.]MBL1168629.1 transcriptional regulator [Candidatus Brocadia sp. AMX1]NOG40167.1 transcriptional regulator [Planctomycetota bacterium]KAA0246096.1 MAG: transcriptional regulator [Candidatus Brocadia sp. AMX2]
MKPVSKVEIIIDSLEVEHVVKFLDEIGVSGYSIINDVVGKGHRGVRSGYEFAELFKNSYIMVVCEEKEMHKIVEAIRPIIKKFGGVCIVSDVIMRIHRNT